VLEPGIPDTYAKGREKHDRSTGGFTHNYRDATGPDHKGKHHKGQSKGYSAVEKLDCVDDRRL